MGMTLVAVGVGGLGIGAVAFTIRIISILSEPEALGFMMSLRKLP